MAQVHGFFDVREMADICDVRASTVRTLVEMQSDRLPKPVYLLDSSLPYWPMAAIRCWANQGFQAGFEYDLTEFVATSFGALHDGVATFDDPVAELAKARG